MQNFFLPNYCYQKVPVWQSQCLNNTGSLSIAWFFSLLMFGHLVFFPRMPGNFGCWTWSMKNCRVRGWSYLTLGRVHSLPETFKQQCYFNNQWVRCSKAMIQIVMLNLKAILNDGLNSRWGRRKRSLGKHLDLTWLSIGSF